MSGNNQQNNNQNSRSKNADIWDLMTNFHYNPASPESWFRLGAQVAVGGMMIMLLKSFDGSTCGRGWNIWLPQTWTIPAGCFGRSLVKNVPDNFLDGETAPSSGEPAPTPDVLQPPAQFQPTPRPNP